MLSHSSAHGRLSETVFTEILQEFNFAKKVLIFLFNVIDMKKNDHYNIVEKVYYGQVVKIH